MGGYISDFLRTKGLGWRRAYLIGRCFFDVFPVILLISSVASYVSMGGEDFNSDDGDIVIFLFESITLVVILKLQLEYELPFLASQYGLRQGRFQNSFCGFGLEYITEWRNIFILYFSLYRICYSARLLAGGNKSSFMIVDALFDYMLQYIILVFFLGCSAGWNRYKGM